MSSANLAQLLIRDEQTLDIPAIHEVTIAAFKTLAVSNQTEQFIVMALRAANALTVSLVAELNGQVVGHIAFSPISLEEGTTGWYGLGPVSVLPDYQRQGIGKALIQAGLTRLKTLHAQGCCLVGHPEYYAQFGFKNTPELRLEGVPSEYFFALTFNGAMPKGKVTFHEAFQATS